MAPTSAQPKRLSCVSCRQRKIKCNRLDPCNHCVKAGIPCVFPTPLRVKGGQRARNAEITKRLSRLEGLLSRLNGEEDDDDDDEIHEAPESVMASAAAAATAAAAAAASASSATGAGPPADLLPPPETRENDPVRADGTRYLGGNLWASVSTEVDGLRQLLDDDSEEEEEPSVSSSSRASEPQSVQPFFLTSGSAPVDLRQFHPYPPLINSLCDVYFERVDPVLKILHQPTIREAFLSAAADLNGLRAKRGQEALMFALYMAAITALTESEVKAQFFDERHVLLARYKHATEAALANADFLNSAELAPLQALTLYVICLRNSDDSRTAWALVSVVQRLGLALDLQRPEPRDSPRSPFEVEMRRRLWWGIAIVDGCLSEDRGTPTGMAASPPPRLVAHVNDADLHPNMTELPADHDTWTEMTFSRTIHEAAIAMDACTKRMPSSSGIALEQRLEAALLATKTRLERRYLRHCTDPASAIQSVTGVVARNAVLRMWLLIYYPRNVRRSGGRARPTKAALLAAAIANLELSETLARYGARFRWFLALWNPWYPLTIALAELCSQTSGPLVERAWRLLAGSNIVARCAARAADARRGALWTPIRKLWTKAREVRARALADRGDDPANLAGPAPDTEGSDTVGMPATPATNADLAAALPPAASVDTAPTLWDVGALVPEGLGSVVRERTSGSVDGSTTGWRSAMSPGSEGSGSRKASAAEGMTPPNAGMPVLGRSPAPAMASMPMQGMMPDAMGRAPLDVTGNYPLMQPLQQPQMGDDMMAGLGFDGLSSGLGELGMEGMEGVEGGPGNWVDWDQLLGGSEFM